MSHEETTHLQSGMTGSRQRLARRVAPLLAGFAPGTEGVRGQLARIFDWRLVFQGVGKRSRSFMNKQLVLFDQGLCISR